LNFLKILINKEIRAKIAKQGKISLSLSVQLHSYTAPKKSIVIGHLNGFNARQQFNLTRKGLPLLEKKGWNSFFFLE